MTVGQARVLVTTEAFYRRKVAPWRSDLPALSGMSILPSAARRGRPIRSASPTQRPPTHFSIARTEPEDMALLHLTSGTTGKPKGAVHVHEAVVAHHLTGLITLDLHADHGFWCTIDLPTRPDAVERKTVSAFPISSEPTPIGPRLGRP